MTFKVKSAQSSGVLSEKPFSDKLIENRKPLTFALNIILLVGLVTAAFTGGVSLIVAASIYGGATLIANGSFHAAIKSMRNSRTEMRLAWQVAHLVRGEQEVFESFKKRVREKGYEGEVPGLMIQYFTLSSEIQQQLRILARVSEFEYAAYASSDDAQLAQSGVDLMISDGREVFIGQDHSGLQKKRRDTGGCLVEQRLFFESPIPENSTGRTLSGRSGVATLPKDVDNNAFGREFLDKMFPQR